MLKKNIEIKIALAVGAVGLIVIAVLVVPTYLDLSKNKELLDQKAFELGEHLAKPVSQKDIKLYDSKKRHVIGDLKGIVKFYEEKDVNLDSFFGGVEKIQEDIFKTNYNDEMTRIESFFKQFCDEGVSEFFQEIRKNELALDDIAEKQKRFWIRSAVFNSIMRSKINITKVIEEWWSGSFASSHRGLIFKVIDRNPELKKGMVFKEADYMEVRYYLLNIELEPSNFLKLIKSVPGPALKPDILLSIAGVYTEQQPKKIRLDKREDYLSELFDIVQVLETERHKWPSIKEETLKGYSNEPISVVLIFRIIDIDREEMDKRLKELMS